MKQPFISKPYLIGGNNYIFLTLLFTPILFIHSLQFWFSFLTFEIFVFIFIYFVFLMLFIFIFIPNGYVTIFFKVGDFYNKDVLTYQFKIKWGEKLFFLTREVNHPSIESFTIKYIYTMKNGDESKLDMSKFHLFLSKQTFLIKWKENPHQASLIVHQGKVIQWGCNDFGQLGDGTTKSIEQPTSLSFPNLDESEFIQDIQLSNDYFGLALSNHGRIFSWGRNSYFGVLGNGNYDHQFTPREILLDEAHRNQLNLNEKFIQISTQSLHSLALTNQGNLFAWGWNSYGQLGDAIPYKNKVMKIDIDCLKSDEKLIQISAGFNHSLAISSHHHVYAWGSNGLGQLGIGTREKAETPISIELAGLKIDETISQICAGDSHSLALTNQGRVYVWGFHFGLKKNDSMDWKISEKPELLLVNQLLNNQTITKIYVNGNRSFALTNLGNLFGWHYDYNDKKNKNYLPEIIRIEDMSENEKIMEVYVYRLHTIIKTNFNRYFSWGNNRFGQLGHHKSIDPTTPKLIESPLLMNLS
jgi:alpha-tubulin suppressor-like RCC1 family protein